MATEEETVQVKRKQWPVKRKRLLWPLKRKQWPVKRKQLVALAIEEETVASKEEAVGCFGH